ncbi:hypothetical protein BDM02DRAFT_3111242 [Thelephora ganbajun]|uniref:Uncharacterized protein n=1 Tax=Thelephora ganbajun TaxID=370292 RepID=A0ACB6ZNC4_THEGA|nr:hypothetical protein BDM02DRAFT_3111242 [Thelephora ganbajun]
MSTPIHKASRLGRGSLISRLLCAAKKELQDVGLGPSIATTSDKDELDALDRDASEVLSLIRFRRNRLAPINQLPREVLTLIPDFWDGREREKIAITLTHVCRAWREIFVSRASLWTDFHCMDADKTRVYLERSKSCPINLWLERKHGLFPNDLFLEIAPHTIGRLKRLSVSTTPDHLEDITKHLTHPAPVLEALTIDGSSNDFEINSAFTPALFGGDLSSLRELHLHSVRTQLPWRGMVNLTSFSLLRLTITVEQLLDFFESAPRLLEVELLAAWAFGTQNGRLVSLAHLRRLHISGSQPPSLMLNHLLIPVGAKVSTESDLPGPQIDDHLPRSLDNLRNLSDFTEICLHFEDRSVSMRFTGPNGQVCMTSSSPRPDVTRLALQSLARFDTSKTQRLEIINGGFFAYEFRSILLSLTNLKTLIVSRCKLTTSFFRGIDPGFSLNHPVPCPKLEELIFHKDEPFPIEISAEIAEVAARRASRGAPLKSIRTGNSRKPMTRRQVDELLRFVERTEANFDYFG